jgi:dUTP pyrophosphatase
VRVRLTRIDPYLPLPPYASDGAAGFDLYSRLDVEVASGEIARIPTNLVVAVPEGYVLVVALRSSTPSRKQLLMPNGIGIIDSDYCGPEDEIHVQVLNFGETATAVTRGERIAQGLLIPLVRAEWDEGAALGPSRGGFGSTG